MKEIKTSNYRMIEAEKKKMKGEDPCWKDYKMIGIKPGPVPNCVPKKKQASNELSKIARQSFEDWADEEMHEDHHADSMEDGVLTFDEWVGDELEESQHGAMGQGFSFDDWAREEMEEESEHECHECDEDHSYNDYDYDNDYDDYDYDDQDSIYEDWDEDMGSECHECEYERHGDEDWHGGCQECDAGDMMGDWQDDIKPQFMLVADSNKQIKTAKKSPAWQRSEGKNKEGGLNEKGRKSYNRETGGNLKAPVTEKKPTGKRKKRRKSFCARMKGMKKKLTSKKTAKDPDSRINKALRKWNC